MRRLNRCTALAVFCGFCMIAQHAAAHADHDATHWWTFDPLVWAPALVIGVLYGKGVMLLQSKRHAIRAARPWAIASFCTGMIALFFAMIWPLDALGEISFAAHMAQHMLLMSAAAPLFVFADPAIPLLVGAPGFLRRRLTALHALLRGALRLLLQPRIAFSLHAIVIWVWHAPLPFELALRWPWLHVLEHFSFFGSALLFWIALARLGRRGGEGYGAAALWSLATLMHTGLLGALITFAPRLIYLSYADSRLLPALQDQQLAGLLMWVPAGLCYLIAGLGFCAAWLRNADRDDACAHESLRRDIQ